MKSGEASGITEDKNIINSRRRPSRKIEANKQREYHGKEKNAVQVKQNPPSGKGFSGRL